MKKAIPLLLVLILISSCSQDKYFGYFSFVETVTSEFSLGWSIIDANQYSSKVTITNRMYDSTSMYFRIAMKAPDSLSISQALLSISQDLNSGIDSVTLMKQIAFETELHNAEKMDLLLQDSLQVVAREMDQFLKANGSPQSDSLQTIQENYNEMIRLIDSTKGFIDMCELKSNSYASKRALLFMLEPITIYPINRRDTKSVSHTQQ